MSQVSAEASVGQLAIYASRDFVADGDQAYVLGSSYGCLKSCVLPRACASFSP